MVKINISPYVFFSGNCREAMEFYKNILGGELIMQTYEDVGQPLKDMENAIMHARLANEGFTLMGSDTANASDKAAKISLSLGGTDEAKLRGIFDGLSAGGEVRSELKKEFWGDTFGSLTDKYGIDWMINISSEQNENALTQSQIKQS